MLKNNPLHSIRWRIVAAYFLAIAVALYVIFELVSGVVEDYMVQRAASEYIESVQNYSVRAANLLSKSDAKNLYTLTKEVGAELGGRVLIADDKGIVQVDSYSTLNGQKLDQSEIMSVLQGTGDAKYGFRLLEATSDRTSLYPNNLWGELQRFVGKSKKGYEWVMYCAIPIVSESKVLGSMILSVSIESIVEQTSLIRWQMFLVILITGITMLTISAFISGAMVQPIRDLTQGIIRIGQGDFRHRVSIDGRSELALMAKTFNDMTQRLEDIDRTRNEFVANASHEIKTPMASIKVLVETLQHQKEYNKEMTTEFLDDINNEIDRLTVMINELLTLVRQDEQGSELLYFTTFDFTELLADVCRKLEPIAEKKKINIQNNSEGQCIIKADVKLIERMCINIIENAIKYSKKNGIVKVHLVQSIQNIVFMVEDNGIGIPESELPYIFDRFYRVDKARARETGGSGLGLSIVKSIVRLHEGEVYAESEIDKGTKFTVMLPRE
ncbi:MAG: HAMP domain-containing sensor histidine kinase [Eubacteriales bacterium]